MEKKSQILFIAFFVLILASVAVTYYRYIVVRDYVIEAQVECNPYMDACFVSVCDSNEGVEEQCTGRLEEDTLYYKLVHRIAKNIPLCDPIEEGCAALVCPPNEEGCVITLCDAITAEEGIVCTDPTIYSAEHPAVEIMNDDSDKEARGIGDVVNDGVVE